MINHSEMDALAALGSILYFISQGNYLGALSSFVDLCKQHRSHPGTLDNGFSKAVESYQSFFDNKRIVFHAEQPPR